MRMIFAGLAAVLLAGCGGAEVANNAASGNDAAPANAVAPVNTVGEAPGNRSSVGPGESREEMVAECSSGAPGNVAEGTDIAALCGCAVDRVIAGSGQREAIRQCAAEQGVRLTNPE
ncbi:MAG: hypothetical protein ACT4N8_00895 [Sphingosinicella sp.]|uniref:hypothetical protein n=1 Tax=Sphingosinicella sp. TaxID=1917971 RepID=UPI004037D0CE